MKFYDVIISISFVISFNIFANTIPNEYEENYDDMVAFFEENMPINIQSLVENINQYKFEKSRKKRNKQFAPIIALVGPPGTGKSSLAIAMANKLNAPYIFLNGSTLGTEFQNSAESNLERGIADARSKDKRFVVVIIDEIQSLADTKKQHKEDAGYAVGTAIDKAIQQGHVLFIITGNNFDNLPPMLKSRIERQKFTIDFPSQNEKERAIRFYMDDEIKEKSFLENDVIELANQCKECSYRDLESAMNILTHKTNEKKLVTKKDIQYAITSATSYKSNKLAIVKDWLPQQEHVRQTISHGSLSLLGFLGSVGYSKWFSPEHNKIRELTEEIERIKKALASIQAVSDTVEVVSDIAEATAISVGGTAASTVAAAKTTALVTTVTTGKAVTMTSVLAGWKASLVSAGTAVSTATGAPLIVVAGAPIVVAAAGYGIYRYCTKKPKQENNPTLVAKNQEVPA